MWGVRRSDFRRRAYPRLRCPPLIPRLRDARAMAGLSGHSVDRFACPAREPNTTKCESEKLTTKLAAIAKSLAAGTGIQRDASTSPAVLTTTPATPEATNAPYARQRSCLPDSAAKVM